jgi:transposase
MMGIHQPQAELFSYRVNLEHRVRKDHPLRRVAQVIDFTFVRAEVARCYGANGNEGVDPIILVKLMFLLFFDDVPSERELMERLPERLDYLWFLGYNLDEATPHHSVLSKARARWGKEVFENIFLRTVQQCVEAGLVDGKKIHVDSSLIDAHASKDSVIKSSPELIAAYKRAVAAQATKLDDTSTPEHYEAINDTHVSTTDPDAALVRKGGRSGARPRYHHHRAVDDAHSVITAVETTPGSIAENKKLPDLIAQHERNTEKKADTVVGDSKYGTAENLAACVAADIRPHLGVLEDKQKKPTDREGLYEEKDFHYDAATDTYRCPAGQELKRRRACARRHTHEYAPDPGVCAVCALREHCTTAAAGRTLQRHDQAGLVAAGKTIARSAQARRDRRRRQTLVEGSFAEAANEHGFKRSRWRRLWRQQIQDWLIAALQNVKILVRAGGKLLAGGAGAALGAVAMIWRAGRLVWTGLAGKRTCPEG